MALIQEHVALLSAFEMSWKVNALYISNFRSQCLIRLMLIIFHVHLYTLIYIVGSSMLSEEIRASHYSPYLQKPW